MGIVGGSRVIRLGTLYWVSEPQVPSFCGVGDGLVLGTQVACLIPASSAPIGALFVPLVPYQLQGNRLDHQWARGYCVLFSDDYKHFSYHKFDF